MALTVLPAREKSPARSWSSRKARGLPVKKREILIRLACAELRPVRSRTYPPAWFRLRLAHKPEGRYGRRRPRRNAWPVHIRAALIFRASFDRSGRDG